MGAREERLLQRLAEMQSRVGTAERGLRDDLGYSSCGEDGSVCGEGAARTRVTFLEPAAEEPGVYQCVVSIH